eukprot:1180434-Prorocentrum_minimum.AAC.4
MGIKDKSTSFTGSLVPSITARVHSTPQSMGILVHEVFVLLPAAQGAAVQNPDGDYQYAAPLPGSQGNIQQMQPPSPQGYPAPQGGYAAPPQGYPAAPQGAYAAPPQGYHAAPQGGYAAPPQGYPAALTSTRMEYRYAAASCMFTRPGFRTGKGGA